MSKKGFRDNGEFVCNSCEHSLFWHGHYGCTFPLKNAETQKEDMCQCKTEKTFLVGKDS